MAEDSPGTAPAPASREPFPLRFPDRNGLAALPWFEIENGELVLADASVGPVIDTHTHYCLPSLRHGVADMEAETPDSDLLLGRCCAHHLDVYANQCFTPPELAEMKRELLLGALRRRGKRLHHTAPNLARDMRSMGVERSIVLGIDMGLGTAPHVSRTLDVARRREEAIGFGSVHPRRRHARLHFEEQVHRGARGLKMHPPNMRTRPDDPRAMETYRWCGELGLPVFWHCGPAGIEVGSAGSYAKVPLYEPAIRGNPHTRFVLGHSGALQSREATARFKDLPNVWFDIASLGLHALRELLDATDGDRVMFGSDWPFYHPILPLAKVLIATEGMPARRRKVLHDNAARFLEGIGKPLP